MALNTVLKRLSAIFVGSPWRAKLPIPDGSVSTADRAVVGVQYSGVVAASASVVLDRAGDIATPEEIRFLKRRDRIRAWQIARQERQKIGRWTHLQSVISMAMRGPDAADPRDAAGKERAPVEKSDQVKKPVGVPVTEYPHSLLAETIEKDITPPPQLPPSPESHQRIAKRVADIEELFKGNLFVKQQASTFANVRLKSHLDEEARSSAKPLAELAAFAAEHNLAHTQARQRLASFR